MKTEILKPEPMSYGERFVMMFTMMAIVKNLPMITVLLASKKHQRQRLSKIAIYRRLLATHWWLLLL